MAKKPQLVGNDLSKLLKWQVPKIDVALLQDPSKLEEVTEQKKKFCLEIQQRTGDVLKWFDQITPSIDTEKDPLRRKIKQDVLKEPKAYVFGCLKHDDLIFRAVAARAIFSYYFGKEVKSVSDRDAIARSLKDYGLLIEDWKGAIYLAYKHFSISNDFGLDDAERQEIGQMYEEYNRKFEKWEWERRQALVKEMSEEVTLTLEEFKEGKEGILLLDIPKEQNADESYLGGGKLLLEILVEEGETHIVPLRSSGRIEQPVQEMVSMGVALLHKTIFWPQSPGGPATREKIAKQYALSPDEAFRHVGKIKALWHLIKRGLDSANYKAEKRAPALAKVNEMRSKATLTPAEFYGLVKEEEEWLGIAYLEFDGAFKHRSQPLYHLSLLVERLEVGEEVFLSVLDAPDFHREGILAEFLGNKYPEGENFGKLPQLLGRILRAIKGQVEHETRLAETVS